MAKRFIALTLAVVVFLPIVFAPVPGHADNNTGWVSSVLARLYMKCTCFMRQIDDSILITGSDCNLAIY